MTTYSTINRLRIVTPPTDHAVLLDEAKTQLGIVGTDSDEEVASNLLIAESFFDGAEGYLCRALLTQTWDYSFGCFPYGGDIPIPLPPLVSITSVTYHDAGGISQVLNSSAYVVTGIGGNGSISPIVSMGWPATAGQVTIRFVAGYADADSVPLPIKKAIILKTAQIRALSKADAMLKTDTVFGVASQTWDTSNAGILIYDTAIKSLVARYVDQFV
jgi:uncharacterized phiE125 gp8 family phage protein